MCCIREWSENVKVSFVALILNLIIAGADTANFFAQSSFSECGSRPDHFWRAVLVFNMIAVGVLTMFVMDGGHLTQIVPGYEIQSKIKQTPLRAFIALEITVLYQFLIMVIVAYSVCDIQKAWVGVYYWIFSILGFLFAILLSLVCAIAGNHIFYRYSRYIGRNGIISDYRTKIHKEKSEILQRALYQLFRQAMDSTNIMDGFTDLDLRFMEKYAMYTVDSSNLARELKTNNVSCIFCDQSFKVGQKFRIFEHCLHAGHFECLSHSLRVTDQCFCGFTLRSTLTEPCFPAGTKPSMLELLGVQPAIPRNEAMICSKIPDSDDYHYEDFWDIKEAGLDHSLSLISGSLDPSEGSD